MNPYQKLKSGSDVRGRAMGENILLTEQAAKTLGAAFVVWLHEKNKNIPDQPKISIGRDSRLTGESILNACAEGMMLEDAHVTDFGLCTTPAMYMSLLDDEFKADASIMVTASHHPSDRNGLKFFLPTGGITGDMLDEILEIASTLELAAHGGGTLTRTDFLPRYREILSERVRTGLDTDVPRPLLGLHVVVDAGNGAGGFYAHMLDEMGAWVEGSQFLEPDGRFPNHIPNPENQEAMNSLRDAVLRQEADLGVIFDADCDRAAIVDHTGREINRNRLIALISAILLDKKPNLTIVTDSVTSSGLAKFIGEWGGVQYRYKRGYRNVIDEAIRLNEAGVDCPLAIETSGHAALRENHFLDDGMYLATVLIVEAMRLKQQGKLLGDLIADLQEPLESVELRLGISGENFRATGVRAIERVMDYATFNEGWHIAPDNREGVRINFDLDGGMENGWFLLRLSVHDPVMPLNLESDVQGGVRMMAEKLLSVLHDSGDEIDLSPIRNYLNTSAQ